MGGKAVSNRQVEPFVKALGVHDFDKLGVKVEVEYMSNMDIRDKTDLTTYVEIVNWLLDSEAYFILCHPHQGLLNWRIPIASLESELQRCNEHGNGCPKCSASMKRSEFFNSLNIPEKQGNTGICRVCL